MPGLMKLFDDERLHHLLLVDQLTANPLVQHGFPRHASQEVGSNIALNLFSQGFILQKYLLGQFPVALLAKSQQLLTRSPQVG